MEKLKTSFIESYLRWCPISLVIREMCRVYIFKKMITKHQVAYNAKILDVGCGDARWWKYINENGNYSVTGIDISSPEIAKAKKSINAHELDITNKDNLKNIGHDFDLVIGNCSLEHIPNIHLALENISSLLKENGLFIMFVPTPQWAHRGLGQKYLKKISPRFSMAFSGLLNGFFQHWHLYDHEVWKYIIMKNKLEVIEVRGMGTEKLEFLFRLFLPFSFVSFLVKSVTGFYANYFAGKVMPRWIIRKIAERLKPLIEESEVDVNDTGAFEYVIIARKR